MEPFGLSAEVFFFCFFFAISSSSPLGFLALPLCWVSFVFNFHDVSFCQAGFWCAWSLPYWGQAEVVSSKLHPGHSMRYLRGVCNFLGSVSLQQRFETVDQCYSSVTAQSCIWQTRESTPLRCEGRLAPQERGSVLAPLFICFASFP